MKQLPARLSSIDVLRAITMFLMIFVNDSSGMKNVPEWLDHAKAFEDRMGFADTIFPAFLFIVGLSLPFAIRNRVKKGASTSSILFYIISRSLALIVMGFYHVNLEEYSVSASVLPRAVWELVITLGFFLIWLDYPDTMKKLTRYILMGIGVAALIVMAILYKGGDDGQIGGMHPSWWGILGIIGWSYLVCALVYFFFRNKPGMLLLFYALFAAINILVHSVFPHLNIPVIDDGSSVTLTMGGVVITEIYTWLVEKKEKIQHIWVIFTIIGVSAIALGFLLRPYAGGISKIRSTPAWVFICSGITILMFELLIYIVDIKGKKNYFNIIRPAGTSTLTCYLLPYLQVAIMELLDISYPDIFNSGWLGLLRSAIVAFVIIGIVGLMEKKRLRLKV